MITTMADPTVTETVTEIATETASAGPHPTGPGARPRTDEGHVGRDRRIARAGPEIGKNAGTRGIEETAAEESVVAAATVVDLRSGESEISPAEVEVSKNDQTTNPEMIHGKPREAWALSNEQP